MSRNLKYSYINEIEEEPAIAHKRAVRHKRNIQKQKINLFFIFILSVVLIFVCFPVFKNVGNYLFFNSIKNRNLNFNAQDIYRHTNIR